MNVEDQELSYLNGDPGAVKFGNFINYYTFHSAKQRIDNLNSQMFLQRESMKINEPLVCFDIGCNSGDLTKEISLYLQSLFPEQVIHILAVDIDPNLIDRAKEHNSLPNITYIALDITNPEGRNVIAQYLESQRRINFDFTCCFSVTMWIHLNNGDEGLLKFLRYLKEMSKTIVLEPQPWHCYRNAQRRMKKCGKGFPLYQTLKIRSNVDLYIERILSETTHVKLYESPPSKWQRKIQSYTLLR